MSIYHFVYKTTNTINSKYYYGVHTTSDIDDGYLGSGVLLRRSIKKINGFKTRKGQKNSEEHKNNQRLAALSRPKHECPHCQREFTIQTMTRYHGNKCVMRL